MTPTMTTSTTLLCLLCIFTLVLGDDITRCVSGYYFNNGYCVGRATERTKISFKRQFYLSKEFGKGCTHNDCYESIYTDLYTPTTFCERRYRHSMMKAALIENTDQLGALQRALKGEKLSYAYIGWAPHKYSLGPVKKLIAPTSHRTLTAKAFTQIFDDVYLGPKCKVNEDYSSAYTTYDSHYDLEFYSKQFAQPKYTSYDDDYEGELRTYYNGYTYDDGEYSYSFTAYKYQNGWRKRRFQKRHCFVNYPLLLTDSGKITVVAKNSLHDDKKIGFQQFPFCMYEVPQRTASQTCLHLMAPKGYCLFNNPKASTSAYDSDDDLLYDGQYSQKESITEYDCLQACLADSYCSSYEFYCSIASDTCLGTCELHVGHPTEVKVASEKNPTRRCVDLREKQDACNNYKPVQPTSSPTKYPTSKPTSKPTSRPTNVPTKYPTPKPTPSPTRFPTKVPTPHPTSKPSKPTPAPTTPAIPSNVDQYPSCENNMILAQCWYPACEPYCTQPDKISTKCAKSANRVCIDLPNPQSKYTEQEKDDFRQAYCRCPTGTILDKAGRQCLTKPSQCPEISSVSWATKCTHDDENVVVKLDSTGEWVTLATNSAKKYDNNADLCWLIRAPSDKKVMFKMLGGATQAKHDILEVWDVDAEDTGAATSSFFDSLRSDEIGTVLRATYAGKIKKVSVLDPLVQEMIVYFHSDKSKNLQGYEFAVTYY